MLSHAQSPARFGINSPPKPPPQQPLPPQQQLHSAAASATTSNLLSLLPPLPRSQSLLSLLSQLTTNLFLLSPSPSFHLNPPSFLPQPQNPSLNASPSSAKETLALLSSIQSQLFASVSELQDILDLHDAAAAHSRSLSSLSSTSLSFSLSLLQPYSNLRSIHDYCNDPELFSRTIRGIVRFARRLTILFDWCSVLVGRAYAPTSQEVTHRGIAPARARLTFEFLSNLDHYTKRRLVSSKFPTFTLCYQRPLPFRCVFRMFPAILRSLPGAPNLIGATPRPHRTGLLHASPL